MRLGRLLKDSPQGHDRIHLSQKYRDDTMKPGDLITWKEPWISQVRLGIILEYSCGVFSEEISCKILMEDGSIRNGIPITSSVRKINETR